MASVVTTEFARTSRPNASPFSLIEQPSLVSRLIRAVEAAIGDFIHDPRGFIRDLLTADTKDAKRRQRIYLGLSCAVVAHVALLGIIAILGWRTMFVKPEVDQTPPYIVIPLHSPAEKVESPKPETPKGEGAGGGGGGQLALVAPSKGEAPPMLPIPPIVNMKASNIAEPSLPVSPSVLGAQGPPPPPAPIGDPTGKSGDFSGGTGTGGGVGRGDGPGVGPGNGPGVGPGGRGGKDGGTAGLPSGSANVPSVIDFSKIKSLAGYRSWTWIHKERAIITPEARDNKVIGTVVLRADFNADGTITNIEVAMPVDYMNEAAVQSLRRCTFRPATINGIPVSVRGALIRIDVHY